jgi:hypothetical protein
MQGTDSGVDTYFGLCTYPGRELRHRIDLKVHGGFQYASSVMLLLKSRDSILVLLLYVVITLTIMIFLVTVVTNKRCFGIAADTEW